MKNITVQALTTLIVKYKVFRLKTYKEGKEIVLYEGTKEDIPHNLLNELVFVINPGAIADIYIGYDQEEEKSEDKE